MAALAQRMPGGGGGMLDRLQRRGGGIGGGRKQPNAPVQPPPAVSTIGAPTASATPTPTAGTGGGAPPAALLQRLQEAQRGGTLASIVGREEADAWGGRDLSSASYDDLVSAFGKSDLQDPAEAGTGDGPPMTTPGAPAMPGGGAAVPGGGGSMGGDGPAMQMLAGGSGMSAPQGPAGWAAGQAGPTATNEPLGTRQYPQQGQALQRMMARGKGRVY